jgi:hypothetical protein
MKNVISETNGSLKRKAQQGFKALLGLWVFTEESFFFAKGKHMGIS